MFRFVHQSALKQLCSLSPVSIPHLSDLSVAQITFGHNHKSCFANCRVLFLLEPLTGFQHLDSKEQPKNAQGDKQQRIPQR